MKSQPPDQERLHRRVDEARLRQLLGHPLNETDLRILQIEQQGFGCHSCDGSHQAGGVSMPGAEVPVERPQLEESTASEEPTAPEEPAA